MTQHSLRSEKRLEAENPFSPAPRARTDQDTLPCQETRKLAHRSAESGSEEVHDSPRNTEAEALVDKGLNSIQQKAEQSSSRNIHYPSGSALGGDPRPVSSGGPSWRVSSGISPSLLPGGNDPYSNNQNMGLYAQASNVSQGYSAYQPTRLDLYDSPSLASSYSNLSGDRRYPQISNSEYYTPELATPGGQHGSVRPEANPPQAPNQDSPPHLQGKPLSDTPLAPQQPVPYSGGYGTSNITPDLPQQQDTRIRPHHATLPGAGVLLYPPPTPAQVSTDSGSSESQSELPSVASYSEDLPSQPSDSFSYGMCESNQGISRQYGSDDNPGPPGYPSGPNQPKTSMKPGVKTLPDVPTSAAIQASMGIPRPCPVIGTYQPPKEFEYEEELGFKAHLASGPPKYPPPSSSLLKRPLAYVSKPNSSMSKPVSYARPSNSAMGEPVSAPMQSLSHDPRPPLPSYLHQTPTNPDDQVVSTTDLFSALKISGTQGNITEPSSANAPPSFSYSFGQHTPTSDSVTAPTLSQAPPRPPKPQAPYSLPISTGHVQAQYSSSSSYGRSQDANSSYDPKTYDRPPKAYPPPPAVQTLHSDLPINSYQMPFIPRPPSNSTESPGPPSSLDTRISSSSSFIPNTTAPLNHPPTTAFLVTGIPQSNVLKVPQNPPDFRPMQKPTYGQQFNCDGSQYNRQYASQGEAPAVQSIEEGFIGRHETPQLRPPRLNQLPNERKHPQSGGSAYDGSQYILRHGSQGEPSAVPSAGGGSIAGYQTPKPRPPRQNQAPSEMERLQPGGPAYNGSQYILQHGSQGEPSVVHSAGEGSIAGYQTPQLRPSRQDQPPYKMKLQQSGGSAYDGSQYILGHESQGEHSVVHSAGEGSLARYQTSQLRPNEQYQQPSYSLKQPQPGSFVYDQNPEFGKTVGSGCPTKVPSTQYYTSEPFASAQYTDAAVVPGNLSNDFPQHPRFYEGRTGSLPMSQPGHLLRNNQRPSAEGRRPTGSVYAQPFELQPTPGGPGGPNASHQSLQSQYYVGGPNMPNEPVTSQSTQSNHYGRPSVSETMAMAQPTYQTPVQQIPYNLTRFQASNQSQSRSFPYPPSGSGSYASPTMAPYGNIGPSPENMYGRAQPSAQGMPPQTQLYGSPADSLLPNTYSQQSVPSGPGPIPRPSAGWVARPQGHIGLPQSNDVYEQFLKALKGGEAMSINEVGRT
ncbi:unnamed protein product [Agarophyton chilense]